MSTHLALHSIEDGLDFCPLSLGSQEDLVIHNARAPICRLPQEVLANILRLAQEHAEPDHVTYETLIAYHHGDETRRMERIDPGWRQITLACTYMRATALQSPELWCVVDTSWPEEWTKLCMQRAGAHQLSMRSTIMIGDMVTALSVRDLLRQVQHVVLIFQGRHRWSAGGRIVEDIKLRSLRVMVEHVSDRVLGLAPQVLPTTMTDLDLRFENLEDQVPGLPHLKSLRFGYSESGRRFQRLLQMTPGLTSLTIDQSQANVAILPPPPTRLLPHLANLSLFHSVEKLQPYLLMIPMPTQSLVIIAACSDSEGIARTDIPKNIADLHAYVSRFWTSASNDQDLPPAEVSLSRLWGDSCLCKFVMNGDGGRSRRRCELAVDLDLHNAGVASLGLFLTAVKRCNLSVRTLADIRWTDLDQFPDLTSVKITTWETHERSDTAGIQRWADERAWLGVIRVGQSGPPRGIRRRLWWLYVEWDTEGGPLADAAWLTPSARFLEGDESFDEDSERVYMDLD